MCHLRLFPHALIHVFILEHTWRAEQRLFAESISSRNGSNRTSTLTTDFPESCNEEYGFRQHSRYVMHADWVFVDKEGLGAQSAHPMAKTM